MVLCNPSLTAAGQTEPVSEGGKKVVWYGWGSVLTVPALPALHRAVSTLSTTGGKKKSLCNTLETPLVDYHFPGAPGGWVEVEAVAVAHSDVRYYLKYFRCINFYLQNNSIITPVLQPRELRHCIVSCLRTMILSPPPKPVNNACN